MNNKTMPDLLLVHWIHLAETAGTRPDSGEGPAFPASGRPDAYSLFIRRVVGLERGKWRCRRPPSVVSVKRTLHERVNSETGLG
ncbi:hypothetical protein D3C73_1538400 [compost metagenome]